LETNDQESTQYFAEENKSAAFILR
jgi:hypothetical protein